MWKCATVAVKKFPQNFTIAFLFSKLQALLYYEIEL